MKRFWSLIEALTNKLKVLGAVCLAGMCLLTCVDVVGRFFKHPVFGAVELVGFMGVLVVALAMPFTHETNGHIGVELLVRRMSKKNQARLDICTGLLSLALFAVAAWRMLVYGIGMKRSGEVSMNLQLPEYIVIYAVAFCFMVLALVILKGLVNRVNHLRGR